MLAHHWPKPVLNQRRDRYLGAIRLERWEVLLQNRNHTNGTTDGNHLQVAAFESACQRGIGSVGGSSLDIVDLSVCSGGLWGNDKIGIPLEAFNHPPPDAFVISRRFAIIVGILRGSSKALLRAVHVVFNAHSDERKERRPSGTQRKGERILQRVVQAQAGLNAVSGGAYSEKKRFLPARTGRRQCWVLTC